MKISRFITFIYTHVFCFDQHDSNNLRIINFGTYSLSNTIKELNYMLRNIQLKYVINRLMCSDQYCFMEH